MNTIDELLYYCDEPEPAGALLLSGEWGCGKTYLIKHNFSDAIKDKAVVVCVSLFGITSVEQIHSVIKTSWVDAYCTCKGLNGFKDKIDKGKEILSKIDFLPDWIKNIGSTNYESLIPISNVIDGKKVILVFDDLERCQVNFVDVLGVINDYSENQKYHIVIVANQDKITTKQSEPITITAELQRKDANMGDKQEVVLVNLASKKSQEAISFSEIKEKIIQRTIPYIPNYNLIIHSILDTADYKSEEYKTFIISCEKEIVELFAPDREDLSRPHNLRSLKCAIFDFYRVYQLLSDYSISNIKEWLFSFICYSIAYKAGVIEEDSYGELFSEPKINEMYPSFQESFITTAIKKWIHNGIWDKITIKKEIESIKARDKAQTPYDILRLNRIIDVDEDIIERGYDELLEKSYGGELSLDEYVLLIENCAWARDCKYPLPAKIDWDKIKKGIENRIDLICKELPDGQLLFRMISKENKDLFTEEEWKAYSMISKFAYENGYIYIKNKMLYIDSMKNDPNSAYTIIQNKRFDTFDEEMADVTADAFSKVSNADKLFQANSFKNIWQLNVQSGDFKCEKGLVGFDCLIKMLKEQASSYQKNGKSISAAHTQRFINNVEEVIQKAKKLASLDGTDAIIR
jgi:hypothetical protein